MSAVAEHLVGRGAELESLDLTLDGLARGGAAALLVGGDPGIGKSRLLAELAARADARGCLVLAGSASELESDLPFWVFVDALEEYAGGLDPRRLASLDEDARAELAEIFPALADLAGARGPGRHDQRYRTHRAVRELLERVAATTPLVLLLDDVHWADGASIDLLVTLLRRPPAAAVLVAMAARPRQLDERLAAALERAHRAGLLTRLEPAALDRAEAAELLGDGLEPGVADALYAECGGNPFYLEQLARSFRRPVGAKPPATLAGVAVPAAVAASLLEELARLPEAARRLLEGAAVAGEPFEPELAGAAAALDADAAMAGIDVLLACGLIRTTDVPRRFRFRHPLIRRAVHDAAPGGWRLAAHERCLRLLNERGASVAARAHHAEHAAREGDVAAVALLAEAGRGAAARAPASAAQWFAAALRLLPGAAPDEERVALLMARAAALGSSGRLRESRADLLASLELLPAAAAGPRTRVIAACAGVEHLLGEHAQARVRLAAALERLPDPAGPEAVTLGLELAVGSLFGAQYATTRASAAQALAAARPLGDRALTATTAGALAMAEAFCGATETAEAHRMEAAAIVDALPDAELAERLDAAGYLATAELYLDRFDEAAAHAGRGLDLARATGHLSPMLVPTLATAWMMRGRLADAARLVDGALERTRPGGVAQALAWTLVHRSLIATAAGDVATALACGEEGLAQTEGLDERFISAWSALALAAALLPAGRPAQAADLLLRCAGGEELDRLPGGWRAMALELLTGCRLALGRLDEARRSLVLVEATAAATGLPLTSVWAGRAAAAVALAAGDAQEAGGRALDAAGAADRAGAVVEAARARTLAGRALATAGAEDEAIAALERAAAALEAAGAFRHRDAALQELRKLGRHVHRRTRRPAGEGIGVRSLTERELQIARLVVDRRTNPQIAAELFLSLKTVETHLRNIFRKLGVSSRVDLARTVEEAERPR